MYITGLIRKNKQSIPIFDPSVCMRPKIFVLPISIHGKNYSWDTMVEACRDIFDRYIRNVHVRN